MIIEIVVGSFPQSYNNEHVYKIMTAPPCSFPRLLNSETQRATERRNLKVWTSAELHYSVEAATIPILRSFMSNLSTNYGGDQGPESNPYGQGTTNSHGQSTIRPRDKHTNVQGFEMQAMSRMSEGIKQHADCRTDHPQGSARTTSPFGCSFDKNKDADMGITASDESQKTII